MQCENKRQGLKRAAKETSGAVIHVYNFWVDFPKPLREREPDSLHIFLQHVWQPHVPWPGAVEAVPLCVVFFRVPSSWTAHRPAQNHLAWISTDPCTDHLFPSSVKTESYLHSGTGEKTFLCDYNSPKFSVLFVLHSSTVHSPNSFLPKNPGNVCWGLSPLMVPKTPVQSKQIVQFDKSWKQSYWNKI